MSKTLILALSLVSLVSAVVTSFGDETLNIIGFIIAIPLYIALIVFVAMDAKQKGKSMALIILPVLLGAIGGLIYYFIVFKEKD